MCGRYWAMGETMDEQRRIRSELEQLRQQREELAASLDTGQAGDTADQANTIERAEELQRVGRRISALEDRLRGVGEPAGDTFLPIGTQAVLRYPDGASERIEVGYSTREESSVTMITADSPLARALHGRGPGDAIEWHTPAGTASAELISVAVPDER